MRELNFIPSMKILSKDELLALLKKLENTEPIKQIYYEFQHKEINQSTDYLNKFNQKSDQILICHKLTMQADELSPARGRKAAEPSHPVVIRISKAGSDEEARLFAAIFIQRRWREVHYRRSVVTIYRNIKNTWNIDAIKSSSENFKRLAAKERFSRSLAHSQTNKQLELSLNRLFQILASELEFDFYTATNNQISGNNLLSKKERIKFGIVAKGLGEIAERGDSDFIFGWWLPRVSGEHYIRFPHLITQRENSCIYVFDGNQLIRNTELMIKGQDGYYHHLANQLRTGFFAEGAILNSVAVSKAFLPSGNLGAGLKQITFIKQDTHKKVLIREIEQVFRGPYVRILIALDVIRIIRKFIKFDPENALTVLSPFASLPTTDAAKKQQQMAAIDFYNTLDLREATVMSSLPFVTSSGVVLLREIRLANSKNQFQEIELLHQAIINDDTPVLLNLLRDSKTIIKEVNPHIAGTYILQDKFLGNIRHPNYSTALIHATKLGRTEIVKNLIAEGVDIHLKEYETVRNAGGYFAGMNALMYAATLGHLEITIQLVKAGANLAAIDSIELGLNALALARTHNHSAVAFYLEISGSCLPNGQPVSVSPPSGVKDDNYLPLIQTLSEIICETQTGCKTNFSNGVLTFNFNITNSVGRVDSVHHAQVSIVPHTLGATTYFNNKDSHHFYNLIRQEKLSTYQVCLGYENKNHTAHAHKKFNSLGEIFCTLLRREFDTLLTCAQNNRHLITYSKSHPITGSGATDSTHLLKETRLVGFDIEIFVYREKAHIIVLNKNNKDDYFSSILNDIKITLSLSDHEIFQAKINTLKVIKLDLPLEQLLARMRAKRVNYQGIMIEDEQGRLALAERKNSWENHSMGYASAGGHCCNPYFPQYAMAKDLTEEYGYQLINPHEADNKIKIISLQNSVAIGLVKQADIELTPQAKKYCSSRKSAFMAEADEFVSGTEAYFSFSEIRQLKLRNIPALELYLNHLTKRIQRKLEIIFPQADFTLECLQGFTVEKNVRIPDENFGALVISSEDKTMQKLLLLLRTQKINLSTQQTDSTLSIKVTIDEFLSALKMHLQTHHAKSPYLFHNTINIGDNNGNSHSCFENNDIFTLRHTT